MTNLKRLTVAGVWVATYLSLWSCALSPEEQLRRQAQERRELQIKAQVAQQLEAKRRTDAENQCKSYGFVLGTTPYSQCLMQIDVASRDALQKQEQIAQQRAQRYSRCKLAEAEAWTTAGPFLSDAIKKATATFENCMVGLPPPPNQELICSNIGNNQIKCEGR